MPEVETIREQLHSRLAGQRLESVLRLSEWAHLRQLPVRSYRGQVVRKVQRHGKHLFLVFEDGRILGNHLRMSGMWLWRAKVDGIKHAHLGLRIADGWLIYVDPRKFGRFAEYTTRDLPELEYPWRYMNLRHLILGPDAIGPWFSPKSGFSTLQQRIADFPSATGQVKCFLLDQAALAGIGNIYSSEILFRCGISPYRPLNRLKPTETAKLAHWIPRLLKLACQMRGTTIPGANPYRSLAGTGDFHRLLEVYGCQGLTCVRCRKRAIIKTKQAGRSTFYCSFCQT